MTRSQTSLGIKASFRLGFRAGYDVFRMYGILLLTNQIRALKWIPLVCVCVCVWGGGGGGFKIRDEGSVNTHT